VQRVRLSILATIITLGALGMYSLHLGYVEAATACIGGIAGLATRLVEIEKE